MAHVNGAGRRAAGPPRRGRRRGRARASGRVARPTHAILVVPTVRENHVPRPGIMSARGVFVESPAQRRLGTLHCQLTGPAEAAGGVGAQVAKMQEPEAFACPDWSAMVPMTDEQRFFFDLRGWILLPAVLSPAECEVCKAEVIEGGARDCYSGMLQGLMDHPVVAGILTELLSEPPFQWSGTFDDTHGDDRRADYLPFRLENSFIQYRETEEALTQSGARSDPETGEHNGTRLGHVVRPPQQANAMRYQVAGGRIFSGLTRVVWELEELVAGKGGTTVLSGSRTCFPRQLHCCAHSIVLLRLHTPPSGRGLRRC
eukprot:COSAG02_NODE_1623_length_11604_cov_27.111951_4_plen_315_part_00